MLVIVMLNWQSCILPLVKNIVLQKFRLYHVKILTEPEHVAINERRSIKYNTYKKCCVIGIYRTFIFTHNRMLNTRMKSFQIKIDYEE
jgi:hypothetical protein